MYQALTYQQRTRDRNFEVGRLQMLIAVGSRRASPKGRMMLKAIIGKQIEEIKAEQVYDRAMHLAGKRRAKEWDEYARA